MVKEIYEKDKDAQLLTTITRIGITLATPLSAEIDRIERFSSPSKLCSYASLVPSTRSSGGKTYHGKLTSEANRWPRCALVEDLVLASYTDAEIKGWLNAIGVLDGPLLLIASPGSGKTLTLIIRACNILLQGLAKPRELVKFTTPRSIYFRFIT